MRTLSHTRSTLKISVWLISALSVCAVAFMAMSISSVALGQAAPSRQQQISPEAFRLLGLNQPADCPAWQFAADLPEPLEAAAAATDGTYIYVAGGYSYYSEQANGFRRYNPANNSWTLLAPMPVGAAMASAVYYPPTNKIYVFGGERFGNGLNFEITRIYNINTNSWSAGAFMPDVRSFMASGYNPANGKIYLVGGYNTQYFDGAQADTWEYDPIADTFTSRAPIPNAVGGAAYGIINGHMYVAGGKDSQGQSVNLVWDYNIAADTWTQKASTLCGGANYVSGSAAVLGKLWVFGGISQPGVEGRQSNIPPLTKPDAEHQPLGSNPSNVGRVYDPQTDTWGYTQNLNGPRSFVASAAIGNKLFAAGGFSDFDILSTSETADACVTDPNPATIQDYLVTTVTGIPIVPGTTDIGNHCDDCSTQINLPFPVRFYDRVYTSAYVNSNGFLAFDDPGSGCCGHCIPVPYFSNIISAEASDLYTGDAALGEGIFTSVSGSAPNRIFNVEWRAAFCCGSGQPTEHFEIRLYENQNRTDIVYGTTSATLPAEVLSKSANLPSGSGFFGIGTQLDNGLCNYTAVSCATAPAPGTQYTLSLSPPIIVTSAVSRKTHGSAGDFDINLPLSGRPGIECRSGGASNNYRIVVTFSAPVTYANASIALGAAVVSSSSGNGTNVVTVDLTGVLDTQTIMVKLTSVSNGVGSMDVVVPMSLLFGDTNGSGTVSSTNVSQTKLRSGQAVDGTNFRSDVNVSNSINGTDVGLVKSRVGTGLP